MTEQDMLYLIAWLGKDYKPVPIRMARELKALGLVVSEGKRFKATKKGLERLSPLARTALRRPKDYAERSPENQWAIDKGLGILDWDGS